MPQCYERDLSARIGYCRSLFVAEICWSYENAACQITGPVVRSLDGIPEAGLRLIPRVPTSHPSTASQQSSRSCRLPGRGERCFLTKTICYTHEQVHFLNAVRHARGSGRKEDIVRQTAYASIALWTTRSTSLMSKKQKKYKTKCTDGLPSFLGCLDESRRRQRQVPCNISCWIS